MEDRLSCGDKVRPAALSAAKQDYMSAKRKRSPTTTHRQEFGKYYKILEKSKENRMSDPVKPVEAQFPDDLSASTSHAHHSPGRAAQSSLSRSRSSRILQTKPYAKLGSKPSTYVHDLLSPLSWEDRIELGLSQENEFARKPYSTAVKGFRRDENLSPQAPPAAQTASLEQGGRGYLPYTARHDTAAREELCPPSKEPVVDFTHRVLATRNSLSQDQEPGSRHISLGEIRRQTYMNPGRRSPTTDPSHGSHELKSARMEGRGSNISDMASLALSRPGYWSHAASLTPVKTSIWHKKPSYTVSEDDTVNELARERARYMALKTSRHS